MRFLGIFIYCEEKETLGTVLIQPLFQGPSYLPQQQQHHQTAAASNSLQNDTAEGEEGGGNSSGGGTAWYNRCKWTCMVCQKAFCSGFWRHVQEAHALPKSAYLDRYGKAGIDIVHYFCRICNRKIPWSGASINGHTKAEHGMSLKEYEQVYGPPPPPSPAGKEATLAANQSQVGLKIKWS